MSDKLAAALHGIEPEVFESVAPSLERIVVTIHADRIERLTYPRLAKRRFLKALGATETSESPSASDVVMLRDVTSVSWAIVGGVRTIAVMTASGGALSWRGSNADIERACQIIRERSVAA